jgi:hypothetical protein
VLAGFRPSRFAYAIANAVFLTGLLVIIYFAFRASSSMGDFYGRLFAYGLVSFLVLFPIKPFAWIPGMPNLGSREFLTDILRSDFADPEALQVAVDRRMFGQAALRRAMLLIAFYATTWRISPYFPLYAMGGFAIALVILVPVISIYLWRRGRKKA